MHLDPTQSQQVYMMGAITHTLRMPLRMDDRGLAVGRAVSPRSSSHVSFITMLGTICLCYNSAIPPTLSPALTETASAFVYCTCLASCRVLGLRFSVGFYFSTPVLSLGLALDYDAFLYPHVQSSACASTLQRALYYACADEDGPGA